MLTLERAAETNDLQFYIFEISLFFFNAIKAQFDLVIKACQNLEDQYFIQITNVCAREMLQVSP